MVIFSCKVLLHWSFSNHFFVSFFYPPQGQRPLSNFTYKYSKKNGPLRKSMNNCNHAIVPSLDRLMTNPDITDSALKVRNLSN